ncbi:MAG: signal peptidase I [bacterium]
MDSTKSEQAPVQSENITSQTPKNDLAHGVWDFTKFAALVLITVIAIRYAIAQPFIVSGASMAPNFASSDYLIVDELSYRFHPPHRGDVVIFHPPIDPSAYYIKRVIGIPGDHIEVKNGVVTITNAQFPKGVILNESYITRDTLPEDVTRDVPAGKYFVMGDNRPESYDSRAWGLLPAQNITGRAFARLFPFTEINLLPAAHTLTSTDGTVLSN